MTKTVFRVLGVVASVVVGGAAVAADAPAVEWKVSDGGNGHWYQAVPAATYFTWSAADAEAQAKGGYLVTITDASEANFIRGLITSTPGVVRSLSGTNIGPWIGAVKDPATLQFGWCTGEPWSYTEWAAGEPTGASWEDRICYYGSDLRWNDRPGEYSGSTATPSYVLEWSADCNGDGIVDYGQIQSGELADTNNNGVPDVCEPHVTYVQPISGSASGGTAVNINGMNFPTTVSVLFGGVAATDVVVVSSTLITAVTPVGVPGMTVVTVNGVGGEAFYYRSNCQSDLDGSGGVDSSDLGILLLDFGSCGESAAAVPQEPLILQSVETPTPVLNKK